MADGSAPFTLAPTRREPYTADELTRLRDAYQRGGIRTAMQACPTRTLGALRVQIARMGVHSARSWTKREENRLRKLYPLLGPTGCRPHFCRRSYAAIASKAQLMGLAHEAHWWTDADRQAVTQAYATGGLAAVRALGLSRSDQATMEVAELPSARNWTSSELSTLRREWHRGGLAAACVAIPQRTRIAIRAKGRELKLRQPHAYTHWDADDRRILRQLYPKLGAAGTAKLMSWRTARAIRHKAHQLKLDRARGETHD